MKKLYVLIRKDLPQSYQAVQAGHAVTQWMIQHGHTKQWENGTLIYLGVDDERDLERWTNKLNFKNLNWVGFREPDIDNQMTAIACLHDGKVFKGLRLL